jgi:hypothetical protein
MHSEETAYRNLANAIILQAVKDYRDALNGISYDHHSPEKIIKDIEKFFHSSYFEVLTKVKGEYILDRLKQEHNEKEKLCKSN